VAIFHVAREALQATPGSPSARQAMVMLIRTAREIVESGMIRRHDVAGRARGVRATLDSPFADYCGHVARWTRFVPWRPMPWSVFRQYPEMATNCVVNDWVERRKREEAEPRLQPFAEPFVRAFDLFWGDGATARKRFRTGVRCRSDRGGLGGRRFLRGYDGERWQVGASPVSGGSGRTGRTIGPKEAEPEPTGPVATEAVGGSASHLALPATAPASSTPDNRSMTRR